MICLLPMRAPRKCKARRLHIKTGFAIDIDHPDFLYEISLLHLDPFLFLGTDPVAAYHPEPKLPEV